MRSDGTHHQTDSCVGRQWNTLASLISDATIDEVAMLNNTNPNAKPEFLCDGSLEMPHNEYGHIDRERLRRNLDALERARGLLDEMCLPAKLSQIAARIIDDSKARNRFVLLCDEFVRGAGNADDTIAMHWRINGRLYGMPDEQTYLALLSTQLRSIRIRELSSADRRSLDELLGLLGEDVARAQNHARAPYRPSKDAMDFAERAAHALFDVFLGCIPDGQSVFEVDEVCEIAQRVFTDVLGQDETGWRAEVSPTRSFAVTDHTTKTLWLPGRRSAGVYTLHDLRAILVHEIGVHV